MRNYVLKKWYNGRDHRKFAYPKDVDKELVPMLDVFNNIPGVRTVHSCCGHGYPGWYLSFRTASDFMYRVMYKYFTKQGDGWSLFPSVDFEVNTDDSPQLWGLVPEKRITVYCDQLGMLTASKRRGEYAKICEFFSKYAPMSEWKKVQEF
jgi:hypothetical protein